MPRSSTTAPISISRCATCCQSRFRSRTHHCGSPAAERDTIEAAGGWGMGALGFQFVSADEAHNWVAAYYDAYTRRLSMLADYATNPNIAVVCGFMCCPTDEEAHIKADGWTFFAFALRYYATHSPGEPGSVDLWKEYREFRRTPQGEKIHTGGLVGSPQTIRSKLPRLRGLARRSGDPAEPSGSEHPCRHLRQP